MNSRRPPHPGSRKSPLGRRPLTASAAHGASRKPTAVVVGARGLFVVFMALVLLGVVPGSFRVFGTPASRSHFLPTTVAPSTLAPALEFRARALTNEIRAYADELHGPQADSARLERDLGPLSRARQQALVRLFAKDPLAARRLLLPRRARQALGRVQGARVEETISLAGRYRIWHRDDFRNERNDVYLDQLVMRGGHKIVNLHLVSRSPLHLQPDARLSVRGYRLGNDVLVTRVRVLRSRTLAATSAGTTGPINTAVIAANFSDSTTPIDMTAIKNVFQGNPGADVVSYFKEASYGKASIVPSFYGPYTIANTTSAECGSNTLTSDVLNAANADITFAQFKRLIYVVNCPGIGGMSASEGPISTPQGTITAAPIEFEPAYAKRLDMEVHELSHTLGGFNSHAASYDCLPDTFDSPTRFGPNCVGVEYGDEFDPLGGEPNAQAVAHLDPFHKANAGWLDSTQFPAVTTSGTYTLAPYEQASSTGQPLALNIPRGNSGSEFTVEYRQPIGFDSWLGSSTVCSGCTVTQGASIRLSNFYTPGARGGSDTQLIDTTPGSIPSGGWFPTDDGHDGALLPSKTFTDPDYGISITTLSAGSGGLTVQVSLPAQTCTHASPDVSAVSPTSQTGSAGSTQKYTFTVTNNDSSGCPAETFRYEGPTGYGDNTGYGDVTAVASPDYFSLAPGASTTISLAVTSVSWTVDGTYLSGGAGWIFSNSLDVSGTKVPLTYTVSSATDTTGPTAPTGLSARAVGSAAVQLTWNASTDNVGVAGYRIQTNTGSLYTVHGTSFLNVQLAPGTTRTYAVQAFDHKNNLSTAASVTVTTPSKSDYTAPSNPGVSATATDHSVTVSWTPSSDNVGVAYYGVRPCLVPNCVLPAGTTSFTVGGLQTKTQYDISIIAYDGDGNYSTWGGASGQISVYTAAAGDSAPSQPQQFFSPSGTAGRVDLSWLPSTGGNGIDHYDVYKNAQKIGSTTTTSFTDTKAVGSGQYYVQAVDGAGSLSIASSRYSYTVPFTAGTDTQPPTSSISSPATGATVSGVVPISATASDNVGVTKVELYVDGALQATDTSAPYSFALDTSTLAPGKHWLYVRAYDAAGNYGTTGVTSMTAVTSGGSDVTPPTVSISAPLAGAVVSGSVPVAATSTDNVEVTKVVFAVDGSPAATATSAPYAFTWDASGAAAGSHTITATAYDAAGNSASASVTVTVPPPPDTTPPVVSIISPTSGATISGTAQIQVSASDDVGVAKVALAIDGSAAGTLTTSPWTFNLDTTTLANGSHTLTATASDAAGNNASAQVVLGVQNAAPDTTAPSKPSNLRAAVAGTTQIALYWTPSTDNVGVVGYDVYRDGVMVAQATLPNYLDSSLTSGTSHIYSVRARDAAGNTSVASSNLTGKTVALSTSSTGTVAGVVYNSQGRPLANAIVQLVGNGLVKSVKTGTSGVYKFSSLPPGQYSLSITPPATSTTSLATTTSSGTGFAATAVAGTTVVLPSP